MKNWEGIDRSTADTANGAMFMNNVHFITEGELQRRNGLELATANSGINIFIHWHPVNGRQAVFFTSSGSVISVAL